MEALFWPGILIHLTLSVAWPAALLPDVGR